MRARRFGLALLLAIPALPALAQEKQCLPAGARYIKDNFIVRSELISQGGVPDPLLGCKWRNAETGENVWVRVMSGMTPLDQAKAAEAKQAQQNDVSGPLPKGVYLCDAPINVGGMIMGSPQTGPMFGLYDERRYRDYDGGTGNYRYDAGSNLLQMTSGPLNGMRYRRTGATLFKPLNDKGEEGGIRCLHAPSKSMQGRW